MGWKRVIKRAALAAARVASRPDPATRRIVFCYHSVHPNRPFASTTPEVFERHVQWLKAHCRVVTLPEVVANPNTQTSDTPLVAITFDDGYEDNHSYALPILSKHSVPRRFSSLLDSWTATLWSSGTPMDAGMRSRRPRASALAAGARTPRQRHGHRMSHLQPSQSRASARHDAGSGTAAVPERHQPTQSAPRLICLRIHSASRLCISRRRHSTWFGRRLSHGGGRHVPRSAESDPLYSIPRLFTDGDSIAKLDAKITGLYEVVGWWQDHAPLSVKRLVSPDDFRR